MIELLVDVGSTYTKLTVVDSSKEQLLAQSKAITTIETSVLTGFHEARAMIEREQGRPLHYDRARLCSSAAGGLRMVAIGLSRSLTAEAAKRSALGAGARVLQTFYYELGEKQIAEINELSPDIILLSGGADYGNRNTIVENARALLGLEKPIPIVVAGNIQVRDEVTAILQQRFPAYPTENVMPSVDEINPDPARAVIRTIFMQHITEAKGLSELEKEVGGRVLMATPDAVLKAARLLAEGCDGEEGLGDLLLIDIGGATTDVHSIGCGLPSQADLAADRVEFEGLREPYDKRTVEGDLGMRYSARSMFEAVGQGELNSYYPADYEAETRKRRANIQFVPRTPQECAVDAAMAKGCTRHSVARHVGQLRRRFSYGRYIYTQVGKDLSRFQAVIGTGGVLVHAEKPREILELPDLPLYPRAARYYLDADYILSAMGLLSEVEPGAALHLMKEHLRAL